MINLDWKIPFDYLYLISQLRGYSRPRDKITQLLRKGELIRLSKGLYIARDTQHPFLQEIIATMLYGPSYISLEYTLAHYQMIPESVKIVTSVTTQKPKVYDTPVGRFQYRHIRQPLFHLGLEHQNTPEGGFWLAGREKALCDTVYYSQAQISALTVEAYLYEDMRMDMAELKSLDKALLKQFGMVYRSAPVKTVTDFLTGGEG